MGDGTTGAISFLLQHDASGGGTTCATPLDQTWTIDSVRVVSEATCGATSDTADGGFERIAVATGAMVGWGLTDGFINDLRGATAVILNSRAAAHTGNGVLRLAASSPCAGGAGADLSFVVPSPQGGDGPALKLFANVGASNVNTSTVVTIGTSLVFDRTVSVTTDLRVTIPPQGAYAPQIVCIPKRLSNRLLTARISTTSSATNCLAVFAEEQAFIDDVEITTDPSCTR